ncbi:MAG: serine/threonine-protein kinase [Acidobacteriota bacterium]
MDLTGRTIGQIRFDSLIGRGGMGAVYRAFDLRLKRPVAVKVLRDHSRRAAEARGRFMREARLLSQLDHPGICRVYDLIVHPEGNLLVLELIEGQTLREVEPSTWPLARQLELARDIADALASAHRQLILHRDLKPDNVMIAEGGQVKLLDFGIARPLDAFRAGDLQKEEIHGDDVLGEVATDDDGRHGGDPLEAANPDDEITLFAGAFAPLKEAAGRPDPPSPESPRSPDPPSGETFHTLRGTTVGTVAYMSPEQALGHDLTVASDMYAFGVLLQELFTGRRAYPKAGLLELFQRVAKAELEPIRGVDGDLRELILALERRDPKARPSAEETRDRLQALIDRPALRRRRQRRWAAAIAALALIAAAAGAIVFSRAESRRQAEMAERFSRQASAVEWLLRAEHLSPAHDILPARRDVEAQLQSLADQLPGTGQLGRAAGHYALGRAHLALGDVEAARRHLQDAWDGGYRGPEVDAYLGLAMVRLHELSSEEALRLPEGPRRRERLESLDLELRRPGIERLKSGRFAGSTADGRSTILAIEPEHYPRALVAVGEGRLDDALDHARAAANKWPWFYEAHLLAAQIDQRRGHAQVDAGDVGAATLAFIAARGRAAVAADIARSDPRVAVEQCLIERTLLDLEISHSHLSPERVREIFRLGEAACRRAVLFDGEDSRALGLLASILQRGLEASDVGEDDPRPTLTEAAQHARRAVELDPDDAASWKSLGDIFSMYADWEFFRGIDPTAAIGQMQTAYEHAVRLDPVEGRYLNALGNAVCFRAEVLAQRGGDPRQLFRASADAHLASHELSSSGVGNLALNNLGVCLVQSAHYELSVGIDPAATLEEIEAALDLALSLDDGTFRLWRQVAELHRTRALRQWSVGEDGRESAGRAREAIERALELKTNDPHSRTVDVLLDVLEAQLYPQRARRVLDGADAKIQALRDEDPSWLPALLARGAVARSRLAAGLVTGPAARDELRAGAAALRQITAAGTRDASAHLELARLAMASASVVGDDRAWRRAKAALDEAARLWPERPDVPLARAALLSQSAPLEVDSTLERARELRTALTETPPTASWMAGARLDGQTRWPFLSY